MALSSRRHVGRLGGEGALWDDRGNRCRVWLLQTLGKCKQRQPQLDRYTTTCTFGMTFRLQCSWNPSHCLEQDVLRRRQNLPSAGKTSSLRVLGGWAVGGNTARCSAFAACCMAKYAGAEVAHAPLLHGLAVDQTWRSFRCNPLSCCPLACTHTAGLQRQNQLGPQMHHQLQLPGLQPRLCGRRRVPGMSAWLNVM